MSDTVSIRIDGKEVRAKTGSSVLAAAREAGVYIPVLCSHPDLPDIRATRPSEFVFRGSEMLGGGPVPEKAKGCELCLVEVEGRGVVTSCNIPVEEGLSVLTDTPAVKEQRSRNLVPILANHPHACLTCAQQEGCTREPCSASVPVDERCCVKFGKCELQRVANFIGVRPETPKYRPRGLPVLKDGPLFLRDFNLCVNCARCVRACTGLREVGALGYVHKDGERAVGLARAPSPGDSDCRFCGACVEVCPTGALLDRESWTETTKMDVLVPCRKACPVGTDVPEYVRLISAGRDDEAIEVIRERALLPLVLGFICLRPCEAACRRGEVNEPVAICELKRHAALRDRKGWRAKIRPAADTGRTVAVVGSGPAGLSAAFLLRLKGHSVAVLESEPRTGGVLDWGIPSFRLPRKALEDDLAQLTEGLEIRNLVKVGEDVALDALAEKFDAVLLATGLPRSRRLEIGGTELRGVHWGLDFLRQFNAGKAPALGKRVVVIGGGNVAVDVARAAARSGAEEVMMACLECRDAMPASASEIEEALEDGVEIMPSWGPKLVSGEDGRVGAVELVECTRVLDGRGRFDPAFNEDNTTILDADSVIFAVGQDADLSYISTSTGIRTGRSSIEVDLGQMTARPGIFAAGDIAGQPGSAVEAIASGRRAASSIDKYLGGDGNVDFQLWTRVLADRRLRRAEGFAGRRRHRTRKRKDRSGGVARDSEPAGIPCDGKEAAAEAARCLQCDLRLSICGNPSPPEKWHPFTPEEIEKAPSAEGVIVLLDEKKETIRISGVQDIRKALRAELGKGKARFFHFEEDRMYTKKESELLQQYMARHGKMPGGGDEEDELF
ncbi:MAG: 4Fe-4S dicluster domain-containing protein [Euryarchaeota archaeon]|nr:4Fe-4S dicluster domain-containing protein [Euryarchaeota archaeon]